MSPCNIGDPSGNIRMTIQEIKSSQRPQYTKGHSLRWYPTKQQWKGWLFICTSCTKNGIILVVPTGVYGSTSRYWMRRPAHLKVGDGSRMSGGNAFAQSTPKNKAPPARVDIRCYIQVMLKRRSGAKHVLWHRVSSLIYYMSWTFLWGRCFHTWLNFTQLTFWIVNLHYEDEGT